MSNVEIQKHELRTLLRIVTECRDPRWRDDEWIQTLADLCGLDLDNPENLKPRNNEAA